MNRFIVFALLALLFGMTPLVDAAEKKVIVGFKKNRVFSENEKKDRFHRSGGRVKRSHKIIDAISGYLPEEEIERLKNDPDVAYVEADFVVGITSPITVNAPLTQEYTDSWGVTRIGGNFAAALGITGAGIKIAILDSGIDYIHPDLQDNYKGGYNFAYDNNDPFDDSMNAYIPTGHGTHVAGIIGARNNGTGVVGVAPEASLYAVKVLDAGLNGDVSNIIAGIEWAINNKMHIINMSIGSSLFSQALKDACDKAAQSGIILVAAAGNKNNSYVEYPAAFDSVMAVSATASDDTHPLFNYGPEMELAAPGVRIKSTIPGGGYGYLTGTSQAVPHVAGAAAILLAKGIADANAGGRTVDDVRALLQSSAMDLGVAGRDQYFGFGLVDLTRALTLEPLKHHYTITRTLGPRKDDALFVVLKPGSYAVEITNHGNIDLKIHVADANGFKEIERDDKHNQRHESHIKKHQKNNNQISDATVTLQIAIGDSGTISFIPTGKPGSSAEIVISSNTL